MISHVASQIFDERISDGVRISKEVVSKVTMSADYDRPATAIRRQKRPLEAKMPSLSMLVTSPSNAHWDLGSIRHMRNASENVTPISAVESVFELASATSYDISYSSNLAHSSFVAELEDTSPSPPSSYHTGSELAPESLSSFVKESSSYPSEPNSATPTPSSNKQLQLEQPQTPARSLRSPKSQTYLHPNSPAAITSSEPQFEQPQTPARSLRSPKSQTYLHPNSPAAITSSELHFDQPKRPGHSVVTSRSQAHLRSHSATPIGSPSIHEQPLPPLPSMSSPLRPPANIKSRAATVIETLTAIEEDNRQLLERAVAAEEKAKTLQEMNFTLQTRVAYCNQHHRPQTAPSRSRRTASESTPPISTFNTTPTHHRPAPLNLTPEMRPISRDSSFAVRGSPTLLVVRSNGPRSPDASGISGPIPGSVVRQQIIYKGVPISSSPPVATISLAEARRREKPLPYIMPLSPSMVPGFVEIGNRAEVCTGEMRELKKKNTFGNLFCWRKKQGYVKT